MSRTRTPAVGTKQTVATLTRQELAAALGVTAGTITRWERDGMPVAKRSPRGQPSKFDRAAVEAWREGVEAGSAEALSLSDERAKLARTQREKLLLEIAVRRGHLIDRELVTVTGQAYTKAWTAKIRGLPRRFVQVGLATREQEPAFARQCLELLDEIQHWRTLDDASGPVDEAEE